MDVITVSGATDTNPTHTATPRLVHVPCPPVGDGSASSGLRTPCTSGPPTSPLTGPTVLN